MSTTQKNRVAVIGAGPAGLTAAYKLSKSNYHVDIFEASDTAGGMAKTINLWEQLVDIGPHRFFSSDPRVNTLWLEVIEGDYKMVDRKTRILYDGKFFNYPLKATNALMGLGILKSIFCLYSYLLEKTKPNYTEDSFESWVTKRFAQRLYEIFFKSYSEKLWGIPCSELDSDFASQRIKKLTLLEALKSALFKPPTNKHKTLVDKFAYPLSGTGEVYQRMANEITKAGGKILFSTKINKIIASKGITLDINGVSLEYDQVISTMPITSLIYALSAPENIKDLCKKLRFRNTVLVYIRVDGENPFEDQWLYIHSPNLKTGRITNFGNWVPEIKKGKKETILCLEYWCYDTDSLWEEDDKNLIQLAKKELVKTNLLKNNKILDGYVVRVPKCYPVYKRGYKKILKPIQKYLDKFPNILAIGRYGSFKYNNQDHSILMGLLAAENIIEGKSNDLWELNTDYEYQEASLITETGLEQKK